MAQETENDFMTIEGSLLAQKLNIDVSKYPPLLQAGHGLYQPRELLGKEINRKLSIGKLHFEKIKRVENEEYKTGEIWYDSLYEIFYLILGKIDKKHFVLVLGGDTRSQGLIESGIINQDHDDRIFCDRLVFKPN